MTSSTLRRLATGVALVASTLAAQAATFTDIVIFGDSLSDTGNLAIATAQPFPAPYFQNRASDGLIWTDFLTAALGDNALPALLGGSNYAFSGARTTGASPPGLLQQFGGLWNKPMADSQALYIVVGGGNDMRDARSAFSTMDAAGDAGRQAAADTAAANMKTLLAGLAAKGAKHVLISNLPDLGRTPEAVFLGLAAASSDVTNRFNALIPGVESFGDSLGMDVDVLDMAGVANAVYQDALFNGGKAFGLTNALAPCNGFQGSPNIAQTACSISLFSDALHPSSAAHKLIAQAGLMAMVPEPETYGLMLLGLGVVGFAARCRKA
jgi:phospholipase/lecithinase/hemolysin